MKVITGEFKNRKLLWSAGENRLRSTTSMVKKAVIDIYQFKLIGSKVLELFAGSGNVGIEFLSNKADKVVFIEIDSKRCNLIRKNLDCLGMKRDDTPPIKVGGKYFIINKSVKEGLKRLKTKYCFDFIYMDPPYKDNLVSETLQSISDADIYNKDTVIIAEHHFKENIKERVGEFKKIDSRKYGMTVLDFFSC